MELLELQTTCLHISRERQPIQKKIQKCMLETTMIRESRQEKEYNEWTKYGTLNIHILFINSCGTCNYDINILW